MIINLTKSILIYWHLLRRSVPPYDGLVWKLLDILVYEIRSWSLILDFAFKGEKNID